MLRGFTVGAEPTQLYKDLHATAQQAFNDVTKTIKPGVLAKTYDDLVNGFGGGYFQPILGSKSRPAGRPPALVLQENMCMVLQPNVITKDEKAGVQFGQCVRVTKTGFESLHVFPAAQFKAGQVL